MCMGGWSLQQCKYLMGSDQQNFVQLVGTSPAEMVRPGQVWRCCREPSGKQPLGELEDEGHRAEANVLLW